jgi:hypothetical protein
VLLSGELRQVAGNAHDVIVSGERARFLSVFPFQKGMLKPGDFVNLVFQRFPLLKNANLVLAYSDSAGLNAFGASAWIYSFWMFGLAACIVIFRTLDPWYGSAMVGLCSLLLGLDIAYLSLMLRARSKLRSYLNDGPSRVDVSGNP